jgi:uncharacterized protein YbjT (DUF2867 family)
MLLPMWDEHDQKAASVRYAEGFATAIRATGVKQVVFLSSWSADRLDDAGAISGMGRAEVVLNGLTDTNVLRLRAGYFYTNFFLSVDLIKTAGHMGNMYEVPQGYFPLVDPADIARAAVEGLTKRTKGHSYRYMVSDQSGTDEVAKVIGAEIGMPDLKWARFSPEDFHAVLVQYGFVPGAADSYVEMFKTLDKGGLVAHYKESDNNLCRTAASKPSMNALLQGAIASLRAHPAVESVEYDELAHGAVNARALFRVDLPSRWAAQGRSANGVLLHEEVLVELAADFPKSAPRFSLRPDFPTDLPHIYPHRQGARVPPCITFGDKRDVMHRDGMWRLVDQMSDWLDKAAANALTNNEQGWEPTRRDIDFNLLQVDTQELTARTPPFGGWRMFSCSGVWSSNSQGSFASDPRPERPLTNLAWLQEMLNTHKTDCAVVMGRLPLVVCWPNSSSPDGPVVNDRYQADRVATFAELAEQASAWNCRVALDDFLSNVGRSLRNGQPGAALPLYLVFPVRRLLHVIGTQSEYEMIAYRMQLTLPAVVSANDATPVIPIAFLSPVSPGLLRRTSGLKTREDHASPIRFTLAGCGSLGSKIAMHLARAGLTPSLLIDRSIFLAHNAARHALLPDDVERFQSKAKRLANIVGSFANRKPMVYNSDLRDLPFQTARYRDAFASAAVLVNTTGSSALRDYLTKAAFDARVLEGAVFASLAETCYRFR